MLSSMNRRSKLIELLMRHRGLTASLAICFAQCAIAWYSANSCQAAARVEAYRGATFGIGRVTVDVPQDQSAAPATDDRVALTEAHDRVLYPVMKNRSTGRLLQNLLGV